MNLTQKIKILVFTLVGVLSLDQFTKIWAREHAPRIPQSYFGDLFRLQYAENSGAFLSLGASLPEGVRTAIFVVLVAIFLVGAVVAVLKSKEMDRAQVAAIALLVSGGIGNLIDRSTRGSVTDFLNVGVGWLRSGIFNVADMVIVVGVVILFLKQKKDSGQPKASEQTKVS